MIEKGNSKLSPKEKTLIQMTKEVSQPAAEKILDKPPKTDNVTEANAKKEETIAKPETKVEIQQ